MAAAEDVAPQHRSAPFLLGAAGGRKSPVMLTALARAMSDCLALNNCSVPVRLIAPTIWWSNGSSWQRS